MKNGSIVRADLPARYCWVAAMGAFYLLIAPVANAAWVGVGARDRRGPDARQRPICVP